MTGNVHIFTPLHNQKRMLATDLMMHAQTRNPVWPSCTRMEVASEDVVWRNILLVCCRQSARNGMFRKEIPGKCLLSATHPLHHQMNSIVKMIVPSRKLSTNSPFSMLRVFMYIHVPVYLLARMQILCAGLVVHL